MVGMKDQGKYQKSTKSPKQPYNFTDINSRINVTFPKGQKEIIAEAAQLAGESVNGYIKKAVDERIARDSEK